MTTKPFARLNVILAREAPLAVVIRRGPANCFCLLETAEEGLCRAEEFSNSGGEPEPYVLVEVWRKRIHAAKIRDKRAHQDE